MNLLESIIYDEVSRYINEKIYKVPKNNILELGIGAVSKKRKYAKQLWSMIQANYSYIGGCKSFDSIDGDDGFKDFLNGPYIWRMYFGETSSDILGAIIYKATDFGRKRVCSMAKNKEIYMKLIDSEFNKSNHIYGEVSGKTEHILNKDSRTNWINKKDVSNVLDKHIDLEQDVKADKNEKNPYNSERHYYRDLGGEKHRKAMFGHPDLVGGPINRARRNK